LAGDTCAANAATMASAFCHADVGDPSGGITAWGCTVADLLKGNCPQAESPWQNKGYWDYSCGKIGGSYICSGHGVTNCLDSWRLSHPNGTTTGTGTDKFSVTFKGVGGEGSQTFTEQATWNGRTGYGSVCTTLASNLSHKCTGQQNQCQAADHCTAEDL
jgi:hypothetical protein